MALSRLPEPFLVCEQILDCIGAIALGITQAQSLNTILNTAVEEVRKILQTDRVLIYRFQSDGSGVVVVESVDVNWTSILNQTLDDSCFANHWAEAYNSSQFRAIEDIYTCEIQPCYLEFLAQLQVRANLIVPILANPPMPQSNRQNPLWGLLIAHHCSSDRSWQPLEVKLLQQVAMQVAIGFATTQRAIAIGQTQAVDSWHTEAIQRQEVQAKLQASQEFLHSIYEGAANSIFVVDVLPSGEFRFAGLNPAHEQLTGLRRQDIVGKSPEQVLPSTAAAAVSANYARCVEAGTTISYEECLPFQGKEAWWLTTLTPLRDAQSRIYQLTGTSINITDRKQAEEKLTRQKEFLRNVIDTNPNLIFVKDWEGRFTLVNQALANMYCTTVEGLTGKTDTDFNSNPAEVEHYLHDDRQVMNSLQSKFIPEETLTSRTGEVHYLQTLKKPLISPDGKARYVLVTATDITDRKRAEQERDREVAAKHRLFEQIEQQNQTLEAKVRERTAQLSIANEQLQQEVRERKRIEEALRESEQQFRQIFQDASIGMALTDFHTHQFIQVNPAWCRLLGYSASEIVSLTFDQITHPDDLPQDLYYLEQRDQGKLDSYRLEKRYFKKNGELIWANLTVTVLREQEGLPKFTLAMIEDITERKQAEELIQASLLEKETLLKEIHHRVKNNLQIISSLLRLQSRQIKDQWTLELFKESQNRVQAMALIHEKLYQSSNLAQIDFQEYITTLVEHLCRSYDIHQPAITIKINVKPVPLPIDTAIPCGLIINELVSNSLKYAFPGNQGGEICVNLQFKASPLNAPVHREQFILTISDNGRGLPEDLDFRNTRSLGLQLVCRLAKQIGGSLELSRSQGTEFKLIFAL
ncbi:PAS domain S-box protein [Allocoleopsis franciscana]|uniref:PAS domain S-box n=1 Tax=Allocoleopsis franciscana PCC 7113 TaxID=1173027 RepID=K9WMN1_9CYAN|nr:PAS domain S-box protein [Allocoleopsis franciscana]AFZ20802.1 PAS domain S-box [Allocoleopsis franciscana PCC 7113]